MYNRCITATMKNQVLEQPILMGKYDITLGGRTISYTLKRSSKARLIWLDIKRKTGLTVTVPQNYNIKFLHEYLNLNASWILRNISRYCTEMPSASATATRSVNTVSYLGKKLKITENHNACGLNAVTLEQNRLVVSLHSSGKNISAQELQQWMRKQATRMINDKVAKFAEEMGLKYNRVVIRDQRSRWGSCSWLKNLNFNWRLIMAPEPVMDYVIIHELCHLKEMSHSPAFWELVARYCPHWHEHRDWLDNHCLEFKAQLKF